MLESMKGQAENDVEGILKIFGKHGIAPGSRVLDLFCGIGRHSIPLAKRGYEVVGYDPSAFFLSKARNWAGKEIGKSDLIRFYKGDPKKSI